MWLWVGRITRALALKLNLFSKPIAFTIIFILGSGDISGDISRHWIKTHNILLVMVALYT